MAGCNTLIHVALLLSLSAVLWHHHSVHCVSPQGTTLSDAQKRDIENFVEEVMECYSVPGLTLAMAGADDDEDNGQDWWTYTASFGKADIGQDIDVTNKTLFNIGSLTKAFTSALVAILLEESNGKYTWKTPVKDIMGDTFFFSDEYRTNKVTLEDLLAHRVGIAKHDILTLFGFVTKREDLLKRLHLIEMKDEFRTTFVYSNLMYAVAGAVAEKIGGKPWEDLIVEKIFTPLGMDSSNFIDRMAPDADGLAKAYYSINNGTLEQTDPLLYKSIRPVGPAGSIVSNAEDMLKWILFNLSGGKDSRGQALLSTFNLLYTHARQLTLPDGYAATLAFQPFYPVTERYSSYALGLFRGSYRGNDGIMHGGSFMGYEAHLTGQRIPRTSIFTSMNGPMREICEMLGRLMHMYINDVIMQRDQWLTAENVCSYPQPWEPHLSKRYPGPAFSVDRTIPPERDLEDYVGTYANHLYGELRVWVNTSEGRLEGSTKSLSYHFFMYPTGQNNEFVALSSSGTASFFDTADVLALQPPGVYPTFRFTTKEGKNEIHQLMRLYPELVVFEKDLDISKLPKPDFVEREDCKPSAAARPLCYLLFGILSLIVNTI